LRDGHDVQLFDEGGFARSALARSIPFRALRKLTLFPHVLAISRGLRRRVDELRPWKPDAIFVLKGQYLFPTTVRRLKAQTGALLLNWQTDDHFSPTLSSRYAIASVPEYDCVFAHSRHNLEQLRQAGARRVEYLPHGADPDLYWPLTENTPDNRSVDVLFVGQWRRERAAMLEELASQPLDFSLEVWGPGWERLRRDSPLRPYVVHFGHIPWADMRATLRRAHITLTFLTYFDTGFTVAPLRTFEIPAAGGFMLAERGAGLIEEFYAEGKETACFDDVAELREKVRHYLSNAEERLAIARAGQLRTVRDGYFYTDRMRRVVEVCRELRPALA
jgi:spore maturation protein CgeB